MKRIRIIFLALLLIFCATLFGCAKNKNENNTEPQNNENNEPQNSENNEPQNGDNNEPQNNDNNEPQNSENNEPQDSENYYTQLLHKFDYGEDTTYVIGHKSPDPDSIGSAIALAELLNNTGIKAVAAVSERIDRESEYALEYLSIEKPVIMDNAQDKQFFLVDHSSYAQALDNMDKARIVGIIDHHGMGDVKSPEVIPVFSMPVGATGSLICLCYRECNIEISKNAARAMLMSILSDTRNMTYNITGIDKEAYEYLLPIAEIDNIETLYSGMEEAKNSYEGMTTKEIFDSKYKEYVAGNYHFGIGSVFATKDTIEEVSETMREYIQEACKESDQDFLFCMVSDENSTWLSFAGEGSEELVRESYEEYEGGNYVKFIPATSRKIKIAPPLIKILENR